MAVDVAGKRQMACKMVKWGKSPQRRSGIVSFSRSLWREVELLKDISHVRKEVPLSTFAHQISSRTSYTSNVSFSPRRICMKIV